MYSRQKLKRPLTYRALAGNDKIVYETITTIPKQFIAQNTLTWSVFDFQSEKYGAIHCRHFLFHFKAEIDISKAYIDILRNSIFSTYICTHPFPFHKISCIEKIIRHNIFRSVDTFHVYTTPPSTTTIQICYGIKITTDRPVYSTIY